MPQWIAHFFADAAQKSFPDVEDRMRLAVRLSELNVRNDTGGPFGAVVFDMRTNMPVSAGVNLVVKSGCSMAHAEVAAIVSAQNALGCHDLRRDGGQYEMVSSTEPCLMCQGAVIWAGFRRLVCGARGADACRIGFDEGPKRKDWPRAMRTRGIEVIRDVLRKEAVCVLRRYSAGGGVIYNAGESVIS